MYGLFEFFLSDDTAGLKEVDRKLIRRGLNELLEREEADVRLHHDKFLPYRDALGFNESAEAERAVNLFDLDAARRHLYQAQVYLSALPEPESRAALREAVLAVAAVALEAAKRGAKEGDPAPRLVVGSVAHAARAARIPEGMLPLIESLLRRAHVLSGLPIDAGDAPREPEAVDAREARLLVVFASSLIVFLLGEKEEGERRSPDEGPGPFASPGAVQVRASRFGAFCPRRSRSSASTTSSARSTTVNRSRFPFDTAPSASARRQYSISGSNQPPVFATTIGRECSPSCFQVRISKNSSSVPNPPGRMAKASARRLISCLRSCIDRVTTIFVSPSCASSFVDRKSGMTPVAFPPPASTASARTPISPTDPPPYTSSIPSSAIRAPRARASSRNASGRRLLELQNTQSRRRSMKGK